MDAPTRKGPTGGRRARAWKAFAIALTLLLVAAAVVRLAIRDRLPWLATLYYMTPSVLLALGFLVMAAWWRRRQRGVAVACGLGFGVFLACTLMHVGWRSAPSLVVGDRVSFAELNICRGHLARWDVLARQAAKLDADVVLIEEAVADEVQAASFWRPYFPAHEATPLGAGMVLLVRGHARLIKEGSLRVGGRYRTLGVEVRGQRLSLLAVDVLSDPLAPRRDVIGHVSYLARHLPAGPAILVGDFNTPNDSVHFQSLRDAGWTQSFEAAGVGWPATWPAPAPVLAIDQIWGNAEVEWLTSRTRMVARSDHLAITGTAKLRSAGR